MAGVSAVWLSPLLVRGFLALYPASLPRTVAPGPDAATIAAALLLGLLATAVLAVPQAARACRPNVSGDLTPGARTTETRGDRSIRAVLVAAQVALSFVLIVAGVSFLRTLDRLVRVDTGYRAENVMTFNVSPPPTATSGAGVLQFYEAAVESIRGVPGVRSAAAAVAVPLTSSGWAFGVREPGTTTDVLVGVNLASAMYFDALGIRLLEGRLLTDAEQRSGTDVAIVNAPLARVLGGQVVGSSLRYSGASWRVVGVVDGVRHRQPRTPPAPELFIPWHLAGRRPQAIIVRTQSDPLPLLSVIASRIREIDPTAPLNDVARLEDRRQEATSGERFRAVLVAFLGAIAVALAVLGTYSVTAYSVARRRREYAIRLALGERRASIGRRAVATAVVPTIVGVAGGSLVAIAAGRWLESFLFEVSARDLPTLTLTAVGLVSLATLAAASSAGRAACTDPMSALTQE
jgi:predicted permease